jgi:hypothetical protein
MSASKIFFLLAFFEAKSQQGLIAAPFDFLSITVKAMRNKYECIIRGN